jgi:hypothetical protein
MKPSSRKKVNSATNQTYAMMRRNVKDSAKSYKDEPSQIAERNRLQRQRQAWNDCDKPSQLSHHIFEFHI